MRLWRWLWLLGHKHHFYEPGPVGFHLCDCAAWIYKADSYVQVANGRFEMGDLTRLRIFEGEPDHVLVDRRLIVGCKNQPAKIRGGTKP